MTAELVQAAVEKNFRESGVHELSVFASADLDIESIVICAREHNPRALPHNKIQLATAAAVRGTGCQLISDEPPPCHCSLRFSKQPSITEIEALIDVFGEPITNPVPLLRR